jgi:hypothetical protein
MNGDDDAARETRLLCIFLVAAVAVIELFRLM